MKIVHVIWGLTVGGTESMLCDIVNGQIGEGHDVSIIVVNDMIDPRITSRFTPDCHLYKCGRKRHSKNPIPIIKLNVFLWKLHPDIIHCHMDNLAKFIKVKGNAKMVRTIHSTMCSGSDYKCYGKLFSISKAVWQRTKSQGYDSDIVFNGIHSDAIKARQDKSLHSPVRIVCVGRLEEIKGQQVLIKAARVLRDKGCTDFKIDLIGDGSNHENLARMINELELNDNVTLLGFKDRTYVYQHLCDYDIYVQPSLFEGFGLSLAEAISAKVPVLTSDLEGPMEVIGEGKYGTSFKSGDENDLATKIEAIIKVYDKIDTESAYRFVKDYFDIKSTYEGYLKEYQSVLSKS